MTARSGSLHAAGGFAIDGAELDGMAYRCLDDCGFCCTFTPEVASDELARLRTKFPALPVVHEAETNVTHIAFRGGCGACTLLERRRCTAYDERPAHCRYFPFHLYFGRRIEAYVNRSCRGVEPTPNQDLAGDFERQVLANARAGDVERHVQQARLVHEEFRDNAEAAGAWGDVDAARKQFLAEPELWKVAAQGFDGALQPFATDDVVARPFYLDAGLQWLTFEARGDRLQPMSMDEAGNLVPKGQAFRPRRPAPSAAQQTQLQAALERMTRRDLFAGIAFHAVDATDYEISVEDAAAGVLADTAADLLARVAVLQQLGVHEARLADEAVRFLDSAFLDAPTIGGWL